MSGVEDLVRAAELSLGLGEPNAIQEWYRKRNGNDFVGNFPWCNAAVTFWAWSSGTQTAVTFGNDYALTTAHAHEFKNREQWHVDVAGIARGDIVFFDWGGSDVKRNVDHVGIVTGVGADGTIFTIEGNYDDVCARHARRADVIAGYGRPRWPVSPGGALLPSPHLVGFPGTSFFVAGRRSPVIARMHDRLVAVGCNRYETQTDKDVWGTGDVRSYAAWQRSPAAGGFTGADADGIPGKLTWDRLRVPMP